MGLGMLIDFIEANEKKAENNKQIEKDHKQMDLERQNKIKAFQSKESSSQEGQNMEMFATPKIKITNQSEINGPRNTEFMNKNKREYASPDQRDSWQTTRGFITNTFDSQFEISTKDLQNNQDSSSGVSQTEAQLIDLNFNDGSFSSPSIIKQKFKSSSNSSESIKKGHHCHCDHEEQDKKIEEEETDGFICCSCDFKIYGRVGFKDFLKSTAKMIGKFLIQRELIIGTFKFMVGFFGLIYGVYNYVQYYIYSIQDEELNYYRIFISAYLMIESLDGYFDNESQKSLDAVWKCRQFCCIQNKNRQNRSRVSSEGVQIEKKAEKCSTPGFRSRFFQIIPTAFYGCFVITGFYVSKYYINYKTVSTFIKDEQKAFLFEQNQTTEKFKNITAYPNYDFSIINQTFNEYQSDLDSRDLMNEFAKEYITFSSLTLMIMIKNFVTIVFPSFLRDPHDEKGYKIFGVKVQHWYILVFGFLQAVAGVLITIAFGHQDIKKFLAFDYSQVTYMNWEISNTTKISFSTGTESAFLLLHFIDEIVDYIPLIVVIAKQNKLEKKVIQASQNNKKEAMTASIYEQQIFIDSQKFKVLFVSVFIVNVVIFILEFIASIYILVRYNDFLNRKSPIQLFAATLGLEALENLFDCLSCVVNSLFWDTCRDVLLKCFEKCQRNNQRLKITGESQEQPKKEMIDHLSKIKIIQNEENQGTIVSFNTQDKLEDVD
eukprot:403346273